MNAKSRASRRLSLIKSCHVGTMVLAATLSLQGFAGNSRASRGKVSGDKVNIVAERFSFAPSVIRVARGHRVEITLTSEDTFHGFRIAGAGINKVIPARGRGSLKVNFDAREPGTYTFECSRPCGAGHTLMRGVIIVE